MNKTIILLFHKIINFPFEEISWLHAKSFFNAYMDLTVVCKPAPLKYLFKKPTDVQISMWQLRTVGRLSYLEESMTIPSTSQHFSVCETTRGLYIKRHHFPQTFRNLCNRFLSFRALSSTTTATSVVHFFLTNLMSFLCRISHQIRTHTENLVFCILKFFSVIR